MKTVSRCAGLTMLAVILAGPAAATADAPCLADPARAEAAGACAAWRASLTARQQTLEDGAATLIADFRGAAGRYMTDDEAGRATLALVEAGVLASEAEARFFYARLVARNAAVRDGAGPRTARVALR